MKVNSLLTLLVFLIAAHAKSLGLPVVINNVADFSRVSGLKVENWS